MLNVKKEMSELLICENAYEACEQSNGLIIATEWNEFRALDLQRVKSLLVQFKVIKAVLALTSRLVNGLL